jgi:hypothetical protein
MPATFHLFSLTFVVWPGAGYFAFEEDGCEAVLYIHRFFFRSPVCCLRDLGRITIRTDGHCVALSWFSCCSILLYQAGLGELRGGGGRGRDICRQLCVDFSMDFLICFLLRLLRRRWRGATILVCSTRRYFISLIHEIPWWLGWLA